MKGFQFSFRLRAIGATLLLTTVSLLAVPSLAREASDPPYYDEVYDSNGNVRPQYRDVLEIVGTISQRRYRRILVDSKKEDFKGDNSLDAWPRILTEEEDAQITKGVQQRGRALSMFLHEYYAGGKSFEKIIPPSVLQRIVARSGESAYPGRLRPDLIAFPYGPDIIRTPEGKWAVIEDNPGFIGGTGDLKIARESLFKQVPELKNVLHPKDDPLDYYRQVIALAKSKAFPKTGRIIIYMVPPYGDQEDSRLKGLFKQQGVTVISPFSKEKLSVREDGVYVESQDKISAKRFEKVGYMFVNGEHQWLDRTDPAAEETYYYRMAREGTDDKELNSRERGIFKNALEKYTADSQKNIDVLKKAFSSVYDAQDSRTLAKGLNGAILSGKVITNYAPGLDFVGDKEFYLYVDDLVQHYLHEKPILPNLPTERFAVFNGTGQPSLNEDLFQKVFSGKNYKNYVIKIVDGRGGTGVYVGPKIKPADLPKIKQLVKEHPESYIVQKFTHLSVLGDSIVDVRAISQVQGTDVLVSPTKWGRGVPLSGNGLANLSNYGKEFAVVVRPRSDYSSGAPGSKPRGCIENAVAQNLAR